MATTPLTRRLLAAALATVATASLTLPVSSGAQTRSAQTSSTIDGPQLTVDFGQRSIVRAILDPATGVRHDVERSFPHQISDEIYSMAFTTDAIREEMNLPLNRWGGNSTERYNHETESTNLGLDWFFANAEEEYDHNDFITGNLADGTASLVTVPAMGWVSKDAEASCSFPTSDRLGPGTGFGPQDAEIEHWLDPSVTCGSGFIDGEFMRGQVDPTLTSVATDEVWAAAWIQELVATYGTAAEGGVQIYAVGNEPGLWEGSHGDVHPEPTTRSEIIDTNITYAQAIKNVDPSAEVIGPVLFGGYSYYVSTEEVLRGDRPGDVANFTTDYLQAMADAEAETGQRLIDRFAVHFYDDRVYQDGTDEMRLQATRSLWDSSYAPQDWWSIRDFTGGEGHALIPRLQGQIDRNYPGTELAITEYNFGGDQTLAGGLAQVDALGIFGREALDTAVIWDPFGDWLNLTETEFNDRPLMWAFRMYRNYDGQGASFGDRSLFARSSNDAAVSIYAAERTSDGATTLMVVNKGGATTAGLDLLNSSLSSTAGIGGVAAGYRYSGADLGAIEQLGTISLDGSLDLPALSATLLVLDGSERTDRVGGTGGGTWGRGQRATPASDGTRGWALWWGHNLGGRLGTMVGR